MKHAQVQGESRVPGGNPTPADEVPPRAEVIIGNVVEVVFVNFTVSKLLCLFIAPFMILAAPGERKEQPRLSEDPQEVSSHVQSLSNMSG